MSEDYSYLAFADDLGGTPEKPTKRPKKRAQRSYIGYVAWTFFGIALIAAVFGSLIAPHDPAAQNLLASSQAPSIHHWLGTDQLGRDSFSRLVVGARTAVLGPMAIASLTTLLSTLLGLLAGYLGGWTDAIVGRLLDVIYALPPLLVAIVVVGVLGGGFALALGVLIVLNIPAGFRSMRAAALEQRGLPYIEAARVLGQSRTRIILRHLLPNVLPILFATFFLSFTYSFVDLSTLSFLGLGVSPGTPDWGRMAAENRTMVFDNPLAVIAPLLAIMVTAVSANLVGQRLDGRRRTTEKGQ
jgi:peptide/nickel transport system permease protein